MHKQPLVTVEQLCIHLFTYKGMSVFNWKDGSMSSQMVVGNTDRAPEKKQQEPSTNIFFRRLFNRQPFTCPSHGNLHFEPKKYNVGIQKSL